MSDMGHSMDQQGWVAINAENDQLGSLHALTTTLIVGYGFD
jgi:hypothetical protein